MNIDQTYTSTNESLPLLRPYTDDENIKIRILGLSKTVRLFTFSDILFNIFYALWYSPYYLLMIIPSYIGFYGCNNYNEGYVSVYAVINFLELFTKLIAIFYSSNIIYFSINVIFFFMAIYILGIITKFISELKELSFENLQDLRDGWKPRSIPFVYF